MPAYRSLPKMMHRAVELRRDMTPAEKSLWAALRGNQIEGASFRRSHAIDRYIVDFCSPKEKLVIELDGSPHLSQHEADAERTLYLESQGYRVIRFWNSQVMDDLQAVLQEIRKAIKKMS
jgi:very-short-patch-repair endonuclease